MLSESPWSSLGGAVRSRGAVRGARSRGREPRARRPGFPRGLRKCGAVHLHRSSHVISMVVSDRTAMRMSVFTQNAFIRTVYCRIVDGSQTHTRIRPAHMITALGAHSHLSIDRRGHRSCSHAHARWTWSAHGCTGRTVYRTATVYRSLSVSRHTS